MCPEGTHGRAFGYAQRPVWNSGPGPSRRRADIWEPPRALASQPHEKLLGRKRGRFAETLSNSRSQLPGNKNGEKHLGFLPSSGPRANTT